MAAITFAEAIEASLRVQVGEQRLIDVSRASDPGTTEVTSRTAGIARSAAAKCESRLGSVGEFDDADPTIGDLQALDWASRWAWLMYRTAFQRISDPDASNERRELLNELEDVRAGRVQEASVPQVKHD